MKRSLPLLAISVVSVVLVSSALGQRSTSSISAGGPNPNTMAQLPPEATQGSVLRLTVTTAKQQPLDRQATVQVTNLSDKSMQAQPTHQAQGKTQTTFVSLTAGTYDVSVTAPGYLTVHQTFTVTGTNASEMQVVLKKDPSAVDLESIKAHETTPKVRRDLLRGWADLKSGKLDDAQKKLEAANKVDASNADVNFLLGYLFFEKNDNERAHTYLTKATRLAPRNVQALTLLGRVESLRGDFAAARIPLEQAIAIDPDSWMAHYLLANVYFNGKEYHQAVEQAQLALAKGGDSANAAEVTLGQAQANLKQFPQAMEAWQSFVQHAPTDPAVPEVQKLMAETQTGESAGATQPLFSTAVPEPVFAKTTPELPVISWRPIDVDSVKPAVAPGVTCPQGKVLWNAGERVQDLVADLAKFDAVEEVHHEELDSQGIPKKEVTLKFDYVASIAEPNPGRFLVDEFRMGRSGTEEFPDNIATKGLPTLAFVFHPDMRDDFDMECEGLGTWRGKSAWLVHFKQREDKPHRIQDYIVNNQVYPVSLKGRAWIDADTYQIVRLESDLARPIPQISLFSEHQVVEYAPVNFAKSKTELWLPKTAELTFDFRGHRYYREHSFDHFLLFAVGTEEKRKEPQAKSDGPGSRFFWHRRHHRRQAA